MPHWFNVIADIDYVVGMIVVASFEIWSARKGTREITPLRLVVTTVFWPFIFAWFGITEAWKWATTPIKPREKPASDRAVPNPSDNPRLPTRV